MELQYLYQRHGPPRQPTLTKSDPEIMFQRPPNPEKRRQQYVIADMKETEFSNVKSLSEAGTGMDKIALQSSGLLHVEGGWPKDIDPQEAEHRARYRRKTEKDDNFFVAAKALLHTLKPVLRQNNALDIYEHYFDPNCSQRFSSSTKRSSSSVENKLAQRKKGVLSKSSAQNKGGADLEEDIDEDDDDDDAEEGQQLESGATTTTKKSTSTEKAAGTTSSSAVSSCFSFRNGSKLKSIAGNELMHVAATVQDPLLSIASSSLVNANLRSAVCSDWHLAESHRSKLAVAFLPVNALISCMSSSDLSSSDENNNFSSSNNSYVFDINVPHSPEVTLTASAPICQVLFSPREVNLLVAGCINSSVAIFDTRRAPYPMMTSSLIASMASTNTSVGGGSVPNSPSSYSPHKGGGGALSIGSGAITSLQWLHLSSKNVELFVTNGSNTCYLYDMRKFSTPIDSMKLVPRGGGGGVQNISSTSPVEALCAEYCPSSIGPGKFLVGTNTGCIFNLNRRGRTETDRVHSIQGFHHGPITSIHRNPVLTKCFMTCGDWTVRLWFEDIRTPILVLPWYSSYVADCCWHPIRPSILFVATMNGTIELWNLLFTFSKPRSTLTLSSSSSPSSSGASKRSVRIHSIRLNFDGSQLAVSCVDGTVMTVKILQDVVEESGLTVPEEKLALQSILGREVVAESRVSVLGFDSVEGNIEQGKQQAMSSASPRSVAFLSPTKTTAVEGGGNVSCTQLLEALSTTEPEDMSTPFSELNVQLKEAASEFQAVMTTTEKKREKKQYSHQKPSSATQVSGSSNDVEVLETKEERLEFCAAAQEYLQRQMYLSRHAPQLPTDNVGHKSGTMTSSSSALQHKLVRKQSSTTQEKGEEGKRVAEKSSLRPTSAGSQISIIEKESLDIGVEVEEEEEFDSSLDEEDEEKDNLIEVSSPMMPNSSATETGVAASTPPDHSPTSLRDVKPPLGPKPTTSFKKGSFSSPSVVEKNM